MVKDCIKVYGEKKERAYFLNILPGSTTLNDLQKMIGEPIQRVQNEGLTTTNSTYASHIFHQRTIVLTISEGPMAVV